MKVTINSKKHIAICNITKSLETSMFRFVSTKRPSIENLDTSLSAAKKTIAKLLPDIDLKGYFENISSRKALYTNGAGTDLQQKTNKEINEGLVFISTLLQKGVTLGSEDSVLKGLLENLLEEPVCDPVRLHSVNRVISYLQRQNLSKVEYKLANEYDERFNELKEIVKTQINQLFPGVYDSQDSHQDSLVHNVLARLLGSGEEDTSDIYMPVTPIQELVIAKILKENNLEQRLSPSTLTEEDFNSIFLQGDVCRLSDFFTMEFLDDLEKNKDSNNINQDLIDNLKKLVSTNNQESLEELVSVSKYKDNALFQYDDDLCVTTYTPLFKSLFLKYLTTKEISLFQTTNNLNGVRTKDHDSQKQLLAGELFDLMKDEKKRIPYDQLKSILQSQKKQPFGKFGFELSKVLLTRLAPEDMVKLISDINLNVNNNAILAKMMIKMLKKINLDLYNLQKKTLKRILDQVIDPLSSITGLSNLKVFMEANLDMDDMLAQKLLSVLNCAIVKESLINLEDSANPTYQINFIAMLINGNPDGYKELLKSDLGFRFLLKQRSVMKQIPALRENIPEFQAVYDRLTADLKFIKFCKQGFDILSPHKQKELIRSALESKNDERLNDYLTLSKHACITCKDTILRNASIDQLIQFLRKLPPSEQVNEMNNIFAFENYYTGHSKGSLTGLSFDQKKFIFKSLDSSVQNQLKYSDNSLRGNSSSAKLNVTNIDHLNSLPLISVF